MIEMTQAGFYSSVQDLGRQSWRHLGVGLSGAMDPLALSVANLMLGNAVDAAGLEITMGRASMTFRTDTEIALAGATVDATLDGRKLPNWWALSVRAGQTLRLGTVSTGVRSYLAFRGGLAVPPVLGSAATDLKGGFGGMQGRILKNGDVLELCPTASLRRPNTGFGLPVMQLAPYAHRGDGQDRPAPQDDGAAPVMHILPAAQWADLAAGAQQQLVDATWQVSPQSNRVGCRLEGPVLQTRVRREMRSHGIVPGVVQLPPSGQPIVQLCDGNTSGGYPVIATVIQADLHLFAQLSPRGPMRFALCDVAYAAALWNRHQKLLDDIALRCELTRHRFQ
ncbi:biotin-dependent carboxyltransferase family protein [Bordetella sp. BOR01]|uniref:5-oxoprolinase subunit C family protein n=1 Tax=Bordetella sp. BOR01 TaxID=2854779 RepID=UPI001C452225|nr:biotin-dependent carboxyltransferase family protein [Bordetella sp. BOR01]MBV7483808.1 biotin-dependent carboxyltransferase family protein [Bordetella sp. BOR01]